MSEKRRYHPPFTVRQDELTKTRAIVHVETGELVAWARQDAFAYDGKGYDATETLWAFVDAINGAQQK